MNRFPLSRPARAVVGATGPALFRPARAAVGAARRALFRPARAVVAIALGGAFAAPGPAYASEAPGAQAPAARAAPASSLRPFRPAFELYAGTALPTTAAVGGEVRAGRWRIALELGYVPRAYVRAANEFAVAGGAYGRPVATLVEAALRDSTSAHADVGWYPWPNLGLYGALGITALAFGGGVTTSQLVAAATGVTLDDAGGLGALPFELHTALALADVRAGYRAELGGRWALRAELGFCTYLDSDTSVTTPVGPIEPLNAAVDAALDGAYGAGANFPYLSLWIGYRIK